jgi:hypothetical protein
MDDLRERKLAEAAGLRTQSAAATAIGVSVCNLAPVVGQELEALVHMKVHTGTLATAWATALESATKNEDFDEATRTTAALAAMLVAHSRAAAQCIREHGEQLRAKGAGMVGKADAIEELVDEVLARDESGNMKEPPEGACEPEP